uniref:Odorant receptor n=1 Tax=Ceracris kiangsu TaxID=227354 RepID=A0A6M6DP68_CERKI|nr:odorant receptor 26 [Ceracris kiangsu]
MLSEAHGVLQNNVRVLQLSGLWPPTPRRMRGWALVFPLYTAALYACFLAVLAVVLQLAYLSQRDINDLTYALIVVMSHVGVLFKMTHFLYNRAAYLQLVHRLNGLVRQSVTDVQSDPQGVLSACHMKAMRLTFYTFAYLALTGLTWYLVPIVDAIRSGSEGRRLPVVNPQWIDNTDTALYAVGYVVQFPSIFYFVALSVGLDGFFATTMIHVAAQLQLLSLRLSRLNEGGSPLSALTTSSDEHKRHVSSTAVLGMQGIDGSEGMYQQLVQEIKRHQEIVSFVKSLEAVMSPVAFVQFLFSVGSICVTLFQSTFNPRPDVVLKCAMYLPTPAFQIYMYCWCGHDIMEEGARVSLAAYSCAWTGASKRSKDALRMLACSTQRPLLLRAGKIYPVSKATFLSMINASYSLFAVLQQMRAR